MNFKGLCVLALTVASVGNLKPASGQEFEGPTVDVALKMAHEEVSSDASQEKGRCRGSTIYLDTYSAEILPAIDGLRGEIRSLGASVPHVLDVVKRAKSRGLVVPVPPPPGIVIRLHPLAVFVPYNRHSDVACAVAIAKAVLPNSSLSNLGEIRIVRDHRLYYKHESYILIEFSEGAK